jgi:hypothetical protein
LIFIMLCHLVCFQFYFIEYLRAVPYILFKLCFT